VIPLLVFAGLLLTRYAAAERERYERDAAQISRQISLVLDGELTGLLSLLRGLAASAALAGGDFAGFHAEARRVVGTSDAVVLLRDLGSHQYLNTQAPFGAPLPPAVPIRPDNRTLLEQGSPLVGDVYRSPISGEPRVPVVLPVRQGDRTTHLLAVTVPTKRFQAVLRSAVPDGWIVGVGDRGGTYVTRSARHEDVSGQPGAPEYLAKAVGRSGTFTSASLRGSSSWPATTGPTSRAGLWAPTSPGPWSSGRSSSRSPSWGSSGRPPSGCRFFSRTGSAAASPARRRRWPPRRRRWAGATPSRPHPRPSGNSRW
jgi:hypothetical protein